MLSYGTTAESQGITSPEKPVTLAVGDGGNDGSMIQEANVGTGNHG